MKYILILLSSIIFLSGCFYQIPCECKKDKYSESYSHYDEEVPKKKFYTNIDRQNYKDKKRYEHAISQSRKIPKSTHHKKRKYKDENK